MCTLVETLLSHPQGVIKSLERQDGGSEQSASLMATIKEAARAQSAGLRVDWLGTAKIALQVGSCSRLGLGLGCCMQARIAPSRVRRILAALIQLFPLPEGSWLLQQAP